MADVNQILFEPTPELWGRPPLLPPAPVAPSTWLKNVADKLTAFDVGLLEEGDASQN